MFIEKGIDVMKKAFKQHTIRERNPVLSFVTALVMVITVICCVVPFLYIIAISFSSTSAISNNRVFLWPVEFNLDAYRSVFHYPHFFRAYGYTRSSPLEAPSSPFL